jgi:hypothetical protein
MSFDFHPSFFPRPLLLLGQALLEGWGTASIPAKIPENGNAIIEQMYLEKKETGNTLSVICSAYIFKINKEELRFILRNWTEI